MLQNTIINMVKYDYEDFVLGDNKREKSDLARVFLLKANEDSKVVVEGNEYEVKRVIKSFMSGARLKLNEGRIEYDMDTGEIFYVDGEINKVNDIQIIV